LKSDRCENDRSFRPACRLTRDEMTMIVIALQVVV